MATSEKCQTYDGVFVGVFELDRKGADSLCKSLTEEEGVLHDWHWAGGRVVVKREVVVEVAPI